MIAVTAEMTGGTTGVGVIGTEALIAVTRMKSVLALFGPSLEACTLGETLRGLKSSMLERPKRTYTTH